LLKVWFRVSYRIKHDTEHFTLYPVIAGRLTPECRKVFDEQVFTLFTLRPQLMITKAWIKRNLSQQSRELFPCQLIVLRRAYLDNITRRHAESGCTLLCPQRTHIPVHRS